MNYSDSLCKIAKSIITTAEFRSTAFVEVVIGLFACLINAFAVNLISRVTAFHANLRWLLIFHGFNLGLVSAVIACKAVYFLYVGFAVEDPCLLVTSLYICRIQELPHIVPLLMAVYGLLALSLERLYATVRYRTYDLSGSAPWLTVLLIPSIFAIVMINQLLPLRSIPSDLYMPVCASLLTMTPQVALIVLSQNVGLNVLAIFLVFTVYFVNKRKLKTSIINRAQHSLSARFQINQNVSVNRLLLPSMIAHVLFTMPSSIFVLIVARGVGLTTEQKHLFMNINWVWVIGSAIAYPILAVTRIPNLKKLFLQTLPNWKCLKSSVEPMEMPTKTQTEAHFQALRNMWSAVRHEEANKYETSPAQ